MTIEARILAVADAYEAMTSDRAYRPSIGTDAARSELLGCAGGQFDGDVVQAFIRALDREAIRASGAAAVSTHPASRAAVRPASTPVA